MPDKEVENLSDYYVWEDAYDEGPSGAKAGGGPGEGAGDSDDSDSGDDGGSLLTSGNFSNVVDVDERIVIHKGAILLGAQRYIQKGSCVILNSTNPKPELGIVNSLFENPRGRAMVNVTYLYREEEIPRNVFRTEGARKVELAAQKSMPETVFQSTPGRRHVYLTSHKEDRDITDVRHPCVVYFLGKAQGEPCVELVFNGQKVNRPRPGLLCRLFYDRTADINTVYSFEEDYDEFLADERADIDEAMRGTAEFMKHHRPRIMLGTPQTVPKRLSPARRVDKAATGLADLLRSNKLNGFPAGDLLNQDSGNPDVALFACHLKELNSSISATLDEETLIELEHAKNTAGKLPGQRIYELGNSVVMPSDEACMQLLTAVQAIDDKRPAKQALRDSRLWRVLTLWLFRIKKSKLATSSDLKDVRTWHGLMISLLRAVKTLTPRREDLTWASLVKHVTMKPLIELNDNWLQAQQQLHPQIQKIPQRISEEAQALRSWYFNLAKEDKETPAPSKPVPKAAEPLVRSNSAPVKPKEAVLIVRTGSASILPHQTARPPNSPANTPRGPSGGPKTGLVPPKKPIAGKVVAPGSSSDDDIPLMSPGKLKEMASAATKKPVEPSKGHKTSIVASQAAMPDPEFSGVTMTPTGKYLVKYRPRSSTDGNKVYVGLGTHSTYEQAKAALRVALVDDAKKVTGKSEGPEVTKMVDSLWEELRRTRKKRPKTGEAPSAKQPKNS